MSERDGFISIQELMVEVLDPSCAAMDVHKKTGVAAVCAPDERGHPIKQTRTFSIMTGELETMVAWFLDRGVTHVAMESTGVYWRPIFNLLEGHFTVVLEPSGKTRISSSCHGGASSRRCAGACRLADDAHAEYGQSRETPGGGQCVAVSFDEISHSALLGRLRRRVGNQTSWLW
ncbi:MAG TPA: transposase [Chloroflexota bacterium]|nr:transposase [Chloroflexota bacterium]